MDTQTIGARRSPHGAGASRSRRAVVAVLLMFAVAACGGEESDDADDGTGGATADVDPDEGTDTDADSEDGNAANTDSDAASVDASTLATATTDLGTVLVDAEGMSLYVFDPDEQGQSTCYDDCASNWPPLIVDGEPTAGEDAEQSLLGVVERDDGGMQVTYDGWPLYRWANDEAPGDVTGQGVQEVWWVVEPDGMPLRESAVGSGASPRYGRKAMIPDDEAPR